MTVLPQRVDAKPSKYGPQKGMCSVSVSRATYARLRAVADKHGCSMADVVRAACADIIGPDAQ